MDPAGVRWPAVDFSMTPVGPEPKFSDQRLELVTTYDIRPVDRRMIVVPTCRILLKSWNYFQARSVFSPAWPVNLAIEQIEEMREIWRAVVAANSGPAFPIVDGLPEGEGDRCWIGPVVNRIIT